VIKIIYLPSGNEWKGYSVFIQNLVKEHAAHNICDVGGGANPILPLDFIINNQLNCTVLDISSTELEKAPNGYKKLVKDIEAKHFISTEQFDLVITKMMAEHIRNGRLFHKNIFSMLTPGGMAVHYFPTLYTLPFLVNKLVPGMVVLFLVEYFPPKRSLSIGEIPCILQLLLWPYSFYVGNAY
jgi:2-polyprenyl-3-methyl-5-hydroxy-6-metoxy-1,4-benzoquinol methylase